MSNSYEPTDQGTDLQNVLSEAATYLSGVFTRKQHDRLLATANQ